MSSSSSLVQTWLVSEDLKLISILSSGLPTSEHVVDIEASFSPQQTTFLKENAL